MRFMKKLFCTVQCAFYSRKAPGYFEYLALLFLFLVPFMTMMY